MQVCDLGVGVYICVCALLLYCFISSLSSTVNDRARCQRHELSSL